jgi:hypothetical protein
MTIVGGLDIHRKQLTYDYVDLDTARLERGRIAPADREHLAKWRTCSTARAWSRTSTDRPASWSIR